MSILRLFSLAVLAAGMMAGPLQASTYELDADHTSIGFSVRHMVVANVKGHFGSFNGAIEFDGTSAGSLKASATIEVASITTGNEKRDQHLRSPDFFDAETHPSIVFETAAVEGDLPNLTLVGTLTIRGVAKEVRLPVELSGPITDPWGNQRIGLSGSTVINRQDYGVSWNNTLDAGGLVVGDQVTLLIEVEGIKK